MHHTPRTRIIRFEPDHRLSFARRFALERAYSALKVSALVARDQDAQWFARNQAAECRQMIAAFGVRVPRREFVA